jgi:prolyl oligopeptidase PreP (S9A serine peptidase family)
MSKDFERKLEEYLKRLKSAKSIDEALKIFSEMRTYIMGFADAETDPLSKAIWYSYICTLFTAEFLIAQGLYTYNLIMDINQRLTDLEERVARIEDELELRRKYK